MNKLKKLELELADNFKGIPKKKGIEHPLLKRWRVWCNGVCLGDIYKRVEKQENGTSNFVINVYKCDIGDIYYYIRTEKNGVVKYEYNKGVKAGKAGKDDRKVEGFTTLKEAKKAFIQRFEENINHLLA